MVVQSVSHQAGQTSALVLWSSSVSGSQLAEWEKHSSTQHKCLIILLKIVSSNSSLVPSRHISGAHSPITKSKGSRALKVTKNKSPVREGKIIISLQKNKTLGALFHFIWCLVFDVNTSWKKKTFSCYFLFLYIIHNATSCKENNKGLINYRKQCFCRHKYCAKTGRVGCFVEAVSICWIKT